MTRTVSGSWGTELAKMKTVIAGFCRLEPQGLRPPNEWLTGDSYCVGGNMTDPFQWESRMSAEMLHCTEPPVRGRACPGA